MRRIMIVMAGVATTAALVTACDAGAGATGAPTTTTSANDAPTQSTADTAACDETKSWSTDDTQAEPSSTDALDKVRAGKHDCYDRVVLDVKGAADVGYLVGYVQEVTTDGAGKPVPVDADAALQVIARAPGGDLDSGEHEPAEIGDDFYPADELADWTSLRTVRFAGTFEGQTILALGVREKLPFHVSTQLDPNDQVQHLIIDIAHEK